MTSGAGYGMLSDVSYPDENYVTWKVIDRHTQVGFVRGEPRFEICQYLAGGWKKAVLYRLPTSRGSYFKEYRNIKMAKEAAQAIANDKGDRL